MCCHVGAPHFYNCMFISISVASYFFFILFYLTLLEESKSYAFVDVLNIFPIPKPVYNNSFVTVIIYLVFKLYKIYIIHAWATLRRSEYHFCDQSVSFAKRISLEINTEAISNPVCLAKCNTTTLISDN